jgi:hypothetical protein
VKIKTSGRLGWLSFLAALLVFSGCGGVGGGGFTTGGGGGGGQASSTPTQVRLGDAPADSIVSFELTISSIQLKTATGTSTELLSAPVRMEMLHNSATFEPLTIVNIPQGTYTQAVFTVSNPEVTFIDSASGQPVQAATTLTSGTVTVNLSPSITIGATSSVLNIDVDVANSISLNGGAATVNPTFTIFLGSIDSSLPQTGEVEDISGVVTSVGTSSFAIQARSGQTLTFNVDSSTTFEGITGISQITTGMLLEVSGKSNTNGSLLATKVEAEIEAEGNEQLEAEGLITSVSGVPPSSIQILVRDSVTATGTPPEPGLLTTVNISGSTKFVTDSGSLSLTGLPFTPTFDINNMGVGQNVEADSASVSSTVNADKLKLKLQTLSGQVSNLAGTGASTQFTLTVPSDSVFALLTGQTTITVFQVSQTELNGVTVVDGASLRVRGLLFFDGTNYRLVASRYAGP